MNSRAEPNDRIRDALQRAHAPSNSALRLLAGPPVPPGGREEVTVIRGLEAVFREIRIASRQGDADTQAATATEADAEPQQTPAGKLSENRQRL